MTQSEFYVSIAITFLIFWLAEQKELTVAGTLVNFGQAALTYSSVAFGFCLTGMALAVTIPDQGFAKYMAETTSTGSSTDTYSNLIFVFSYAALAHLFLVFTSIVAVTAFQPSDLLIPGFSHYKRSPFSFTLVFGTVYAMSQFFITVITLSQVGQVYIHHLKHPKRQG